MYKQQESDVSFVSQLDPNGYPEMEITHSHPKPIVVSYSILQEKITTLENMDIEELRSIFMNEIKVLENLSVEERNAQLQNIFTLLTALDPPYALQFSIKNEFSLYEHRLYWDLISTPGLSEIDYVVDFLKNDFLSSFSNYNKINFLNLIFDYYSSHSKEAIDKFNYVFKGSDNLNFVFLKENVDLDYYFSERVMSLFSKEDLSQLFRFHSFNNKMEYLFAPENDKALFILSKMTKKIKSITGHSSEFLDGALSLYDEDFILLLIDVYDKFVGSEENEKAFEETYLENDNFVEINEIINAISFYDYDNDSYIKDLFNSNNFDKFLNLLNKQRNKNYSYIFEDDFMKKIEEDTFDPIIDFKLIVDESSLKRFKHGLLSNVYGISLSYAEHLKQHYGEHIETLEKDIMEKDLPILELLKAIINIVNLDQPNFKEKLNTLRMAYLNKIKEKGIDYKNNDVSAIIIEGLLNKMYMNTYNKVLTKNQNNYSFIENDSGVEVFDAGVDFNFMVTALGGGTVVNFFDDKVNMASKWNTAAVDNSQGLCASFINNENLGVISLEYPLLAFDNIPEYSLNMMGPNDIFSRIDRFNLRGSNSSTCGVNRYFIPASIMADETRYGYNEILLDRYLIDDEKGNLKLQPSYVIFYKLEYDGNYKDTECYKNTLKTAKDFGIPIIIIDVVKLKENELKIIKEKEEELFSSKVSKPDLLNEIITRYMNNYTGDLTIEGEQSDLGCLSYSSFVKKEIKNFIEKLLIFTATIDDISLRSKWIYDLNSIYLEEKRKYDKASSIRGWNCSVNSFLFEDEDLDTIIKLSVEPEFDEFFHIYKNDNNHKNEYEVDYNNYPLVELQNNISAAFMTKKSFIPIIQTIVNLVNYLDMGTCLRIGDYNYNGVLGNLFYSISISDSDVFLIEDLVCSYFLGNCDVRNLECLACLNLGKLNKKINIDENYDWNNDVMNSVYSNLIINSETTEYNPNIVNQFIEKIESTSDEKILEIFSPIIQAQAENTTDSVNDICLRILKKKAEFRNSFEKLNAQVAFLKNDDVINYSSDNYGNSSKK